MNCKELSALMDSYLDHELSQAETTRVETHLANCRACRMELDGMKRAIEALETCKHSLEPPDILSAVKEEVADRSRRAIVSFFRWSLAAAAILLIFISGLRLHCPQKPVMQAIVRPHGERTLTAKSKGHTDILAAGVDEPRTVKSHTKRRAKRKPMIARMVAPAPAVHPKPEAEYIIVCMSKESPDLPAGNMKGAALESAASVQACRVDAAEPMPTACDGDMRTFAKAAPNQLSASRAESSSYSIRMTDHITGQITDLSVHKNAQAGSESKLVIEYSVANAEPADKKRSD